MNIDIIVAEGTAHGEFGGSVPVQGTGTVQRFGEQLHYWYFRARGSAWSLDIGTTADDDGYVDDTTAVWSMSRTWGTFPQAGWMDEYEASAVIVYAITTYLKREEPTMPWRVWATYPDPCQQADCTEPLSYHAALRGTEHTFTSSVREGLIMDIARSGLITSVAQALWLGVEVGKL